MDTTKHFGKLRDELLNGEIFYTLKEAKILIESGGDITRRCGHIVLLGIGLRYQKSLRPAPTSNGYDQTELLYTNSRVDGLGGAHQSDPKL